MLVFYSRKFFWWGSMIIHIHPDRLAWPGIGKKAALDAWKKSDAWRALALVVPRY